MSKKIAISTSLFITLSLLFLLLFFTAFSALSQYNRYQSYLLQKNNVDSLVAIDDFKEAIIESQSSFSSYLESRSSYKLVEFYKAMQKAENSLQSIKMISSISEDIAYTVYAMEKSYKAFHRACERTFEYFDFDMQNYLAQKQRADMIASYLVTYSGDLVSSVIENNTESLAEDSRSYGIFFSVNIAFLVLFGIILVVILLIFSKNLRKPLSKLSETAEKISSGDLSARAENFSSDKQVLLLTDTFNNMADDILKMMEDLRMKTDAEMKLLEEQKKNIEVQAQLDRATFLALQTQTNPHFLFNTLNSIDRTIQLGKIEDGRMMLRSISTLMRYNLTDGSTPAVLREEIDATLEYLKIQKVRFSSRLEYSINIDDVLLDSILLPRFTLQPLVENAIIHGLKEKENGGFISIKCIETANNILLYVSDNGKGMSEEKIKECLNRDIFESKHIGISNTKSRIELFTGKEGSFKIESKIGGGTTIIISLNK